MSNGKVKVYKNPDRSKANVVKPYVPQYQILGVEPEEFKSAVVPSNYPQAKPSQDNPRAPRPPIRQNYAPITPAVVGRGFGPIPNVGNNVEHTWSGVDEEIVDDLSGDQVIDPNHPMIDNNEFVSEEALGQLTPSTQSLHSFMQESAQQSATTDDLFPILQELEEGTYLLLANGIAVCSGPLAEIQEQASALVFGEHDLCGGDPIPVEDIIIVKRAVVKFGLFLE